MNAISQYINDALHELRQVRWPTRHQAIRLSAIVIVFVIVTTAIFGLLDLALSAGVQFLLSFT